MAWPHFPRSRPSRWQFAGAWAAALCASAACHQQHDGPVPVLAKAATDPTIVCGEQRTTEVTLHGQHFSPAPVNGPARLMAALPTVTLARSARLDGGDTDALEVIFSGDPTAPENTEALTWQDQTHMQLTLDQALSIAGESGRLPAGLYDAAIENPQAGRASAARALAVVDRPTLTEVSPWLVCVAQQDRELTVRGSGLLRIEGGLPALHAGSDDAGFAVSELSDCSAIALPDTDAALCASARVTLPQGSLPPGEHQLRLTNPEGAACHSEDDLTLQVVDAPAIAEFSPAVVCTERGRQTLSIRGENFIQLGMAQPTVRLGGREVAVGSLARCTNTRTRGISLRTCSQINLDLDLHDWPAGDIDVEVANPDAVGCSVTATGLVRIAETPVLDQAGQVELCSNASGALTLTGSRFQPDMQATIDGSPVSTQFISDTELQVSISQLPAGMRTLSVRNVDGCAATATIALRVQPCPNDKPR